MADPNFKKISDMAALTTAAADDIIPIVDVSEAADANKNKKITTANLRKGITNAELAGSITAAKIAGISSDPNADRIVFWDDSATSLAYLAPSTGLQVTDTSITTKDSQIVHDNLSGFVANEHINHSGVTITAGAGLSGGGTIAASRTINLDHLGIEDLTDPGGDRIAFWDDSAGAMKWLSPGTGLAISDTTLNAGGIGSGDIADGAVTTAKIANDAVTSAKIADGAVTNAKLGDDVGVWSSWTPTVVGLNAGYQCHAHYSTVGNTLYFQIELGGNSNGTSFTATLPAYSSLPWGGTYKIKALGSVDPLAGMCQTLEGTTTDAGLIIVDVDSNKLVFYPTSSLSTNWASSGTKAVLGCGFIYYYLP